jgi:thioredoxin-like negative regulator of GroEL
MGRALRALFVLAAATAPAGAERAEQKPDGQATYVNASSAAQAGHYDEALDLATLSATLPGKHKVAAKLLYADILARKGEHQRARNFYEGLRLSADRDTKAIIDDRIAALDKQSCTPLKPWVAPAKQPTATYEEAQAAFEQHDYTRAVTLAQRVATGGGPRVMDAKILYADSIFRQGDYKRARELYRGLHRTATGAMQASLAKRIAAANRKLALPDGDGLD